MGKPKQADVVRILRAEASIAVPKHERKEMLEALDAARREVVDGKISALAIACVRRRAKKFVPVTWTAPADTDLMRLTGALRAAEHIVASGAVEESARQIEEP